MMTTQENSISEWINNHELTKEFEESRNEEYLETLSNADKSYNAIRNGLNLLDLVAESEEHFGVKISCEDFAKISSPEDVKLALVAAIK